MEFNEKLQALRKQKGLTQEELADALYVSRTAVSKWESGRGYPSIDTLKDISAFFNITIDELLSGDELLNIAENDNKQKQNRFRDVVFGLLDVSAVLFFFVPFFAERSEVIKSVNLLSLSVSPYLKTAYFVLIIAVILLSVLTLIYGGAFAKYKNIFSIILTSILLLLFILNLQPYAATLVFAFLLIKALILKVSRV
ncbi:MAG: helix-turn-helix transcriptional regulator [Clostridia bacterium]|nr:helix-turn-helix transcriptional regulator [Clostridia bacterium]